MSMPAWVRKLARVAGWSGALLVLALVAVLVVLLAVSPGRPELIVDADGRPVPGSLAEKHYVDVHGVRQGMFIKSLDPAQPVLLYVHGGMPDYFLSGQHPTQLERAFTVAWWDQRGHGLSYSPDLRPETVTLDQLVDDLVGVAEHLRDRFGHAKIYLMGHSGGTFLAVHAIARRPDLFHAYIGVAQMVHQIESERRAHAYMLERYAELGDADMVAALRAAPVTLADGTSPAYLELRDPAMHALGIGTMRQMRSIVTDFFIPSLWFREYTLGEKLDLWRGKARAGVSVIWDEQLYTDLRAQLTRFEIPIYLVHGRYDYTCNYALARDYFDRIEAPIKGFYTFEGSAHSPMFEEPDALLRILRADVLRARNQLADPAGP